MINLDTRLHRNIVIACLIFAIAQTAHFFIYFEQSFLLSLRWSIKSAFIWLAIFYLVVAIANKSERRFKGRGYDELKWSLFAIICGALHVFIAVAIDAILGTASRPLLEDFLHLYSKRWLQNTLISSLFILWRQPWTLGSEEHPTSSANTEHGNSSHKDSISLKVVEGNHTHWLNTQHISHLESLGNYVHIYSHDSKHLVRNTLSALAEQLAEYGFLRISRSVVVNRQFVKSVSRPSSYQVMLELNDGQCVTVGRTYWKTVKSSLQL